MRKILIHPNMVQLWIYLHAVANLLEWWFALTPEDRLAIAISVQPEQEA